MACNSKIKAGLMVGALTAIALLFCSCTAAPLLSQREIVHAVFLQQHGTQSTALLLLADSTQTSEGEEPPSFRTSLGRGQNPAQALERAESSLNGEVFYGLMDLAVLPLESDWQEAVEAARLLYQRTKPAPQILLLMMEELPDEQLKEGAGSLYQEIMGAEERYGLKNGLQMMFAAQNECALPVWQGTGYGFAFLQQGKENQQLPDDLSAQLAAVLAGQANCLDCAFAQGQADVQAQASVQHKSERSGENELHLTLTNPDIQDLSGCHWDRAELEQLLSEELEQTFSGFVPGLYTDHFDPLRTTVWVTATSGIQPQISAPQLFIHFDE